MGRGDNNIELGENINDYPSTYSKTFMMIKGQWSFYSTYSTYSIIMNRPAGKREEKGNNERTEKEHTFPSIKCKKKKEINTHPFS